MSMSELYAKAAAFETKLSGVADHLVGEFRTLVDDLLGQGKKDAAQLATEAEQATQTAAAGLSPQSAPAAAPIEGPKPASTPADGSPNSSSQS